MIEKAVDHYTKTMEIIKKHNIKKLQLHGDHTLHKYEKINSVILISAFFFHKNRVFSITVTASNKSAYI